MRVKPAKKRTWIVALCLALTLTCLPGAAFAVNIYTTSDMCVEKIKEFEDLRLTAYTDINGKWYIGYGSNCEAGAYPNGITEEQAEALLRKDLATAEDIVNGMLVQYGISVTQYQFDALVDLTYNLGRQWINPGYRLCSYLINGIDRYTEREVVDAIATWCHAGTAVLDNLVTRRLWDAYLFLYGDYENNGPEMYCYIDYDVNGGVQDVRQDSRTVFYPVALPYGELPAPTKEGQSFLGWFTAEGEQLNDMEIAVLSKVVYARWGDAVSTPIPVEPEETVDYSAWVNPYLDVAEGAWYYTYIRELSYHSIVGGDPGGTFRPESAISAGEALKLILLAATEAEDPGNSLAGGHWAENYLALADGLGCVYPGEIQNLDNMIDRATIARITAIAMGLELKTGDSPFADIDDPYTLTLFEAGIIEGDTVEGHRYFSPYDNISRAEACAIVSRVRGYTPANNPTISGYIEYGKNRVPVMWDVPAAPYNTDLLVREGSIMHYYDPNYTTEIGMDVAVFQGEIDWDKVARSGMVSFAIIRAGARGWGAEGKLIADGQFERNLTEAQRVGLKTGVYYYSTATTEAEAIEEAQQVLQALGGRALEYPVVYDWEIDSSKARNANLDKATATRCAIAFCETIVQAGYTPMIYIGLETGYNRLDLSRLTGYDLWFAQYNKQNRPTMYYNYRIWQYTSSGSVPGIEGKVDMDIAFIPY